MPSQSGISISRSTVHEHVHAGKVFDVTHLWSAVANGASVNLWIDVAASSDAHMFFSVHGTGKGTLTLVENPTISVAGTSKTLINKNRRSSRTSVHSVERDVTYTGGTTLMDLLVVGGSGGNSQGSETSEHMEWILKPGNTYVLKLTNTAGTAQDFNMQIMHYENP